MTGSGKILGIILILAGIAIAVIGSLWLLAGKTAEQISAAGVMLGLGLLVIIIVLPLIAAGTYFFVRGGSEAREFAEMDRQRKLLNIVTTRGQVRVSDLALELKMSRSEVKDAVYDLVGKELFVGYIDWKEGVLYAKEAAQMTTGKCPSCGAPRTLAGKGVVKCEYCGADLFVPATT
jgi:hypothetical protein